MISQVELSLIEFDLSRIKDFYNTESIVLDFSLRAPNSRASYFECRIDSNQWQKCESPFNAAMIAHGGHDFSVKAIDSKGVLLSQSQRHFKVDLIAPSLELTSYPSKVTGSKEAVFSLSMSDVDAGIMGNAKCSIDDAESVECPVPLKLFNLADGDHKLSVTAFDNANNSANLVFNWRVDTTMPTLLLIDTLPPWIKSQNVQLSFSASDSSGGSVKVTCKFDGGIPELCPYSFSKTGLTEGRHTLFIEVTDSAGNITSQKIIWGVDFTNPILFVNNPIKDNFAQLDTLQYRMSLSTSDSLSGIKSVEYFLDNQAATELTLDSFLPFPKSPSFGQHRLTIKVTDQAGNFAKEVDLFNLYQIDFTDISVGLKHSCGIDQFGVAYCWGDNSVGQLGNGTKDQGSFPFPVAGDDYFTQLSLSSFTSCGLTKAGLVKCWGNRYPSVPTYISSNSETFKAISGGGNNFCGITTAGAAKCWGYNKFGELGDNTTLGLVSNGLFKPEPTAVWSSDTFINISVGQSFACAVNSLNQVKCWGVNDNGQLGDGTTITRTVPTLVSPTVTGPGKFMKISSGLFSTCAIGDIGKVKCWGHETSWGSYLYNGGTFTGISSGMFSCGIRPDSSLVCVGNGLSTTLGSWNPFTSSSYLFSKVSVAPIDFLCGLTLPSPTTHYREIKCAKGELASQNLQLGLGDLDTVMSSW